MASLEPISAVPGLWRIAAETNGYLLVRGERSLLIDCPEEDLSPLLQQAGLPAPSIILHTQVQEEHCREWAAFPEAEVFVFSESEEVARRSATFFAECDTVWPPSRAWDTLGEEKYGVAGCTTERPPRQALRLAGVLRPGEVFRWGDTEFTVLGIPGSGKRAIGFYWGEQRVLFSGDLLFAGGYLVNFYDLERSYGILSGYTQLRESLALVRKLEPALLLPSTGPLISDPARDIAELLARLQAFRHAPALRAEEEAATTNYTPLREFGRYREVLAGVYQCTNAGNLILFVNGEGRGLMIDPDPCVWLSWEENCREMHADLDLLERESGLRRVEVALLTHYHGDHLQYCDLLRERYSTEIASTPDVAAVVERPAEFPYPCTIDWYGFPFDHVAIDRYLPYDQPFMWHDLPVQPIHLPGHCFAHAGFVVKWRQTCLVCTGDTIQYGRGPIGSGVPILYNDTAWPDRGTLAAVNHLMAVHPDLVLCGHSQSFFDRDGAILRDMASAAETRQRLAVELIHDRNLLRAMTPPGYDDVRPAQTYRPACAKP